MAMEKVRVLFVCMGNICRSPTAQGVFERIVQEKGVAERIVIDSAGTHAYHVGEPPDRRSQAAALGRGVDLSGQRARRIEKHDLDHFDYVLVMDQGNLEEVLHLSSPEHRERIHLFMTFAGRWQESEVPDPYYGGGSGFQQVLDMVEDAAEGLLEHIHRHHL